MEDREGRRNESCFRDRWRDSVASTDGPSIATTRHVLLTLSLHMDTTGSQCFPSHRSLAERTGLSRRAVCAHLGLAVDLKWISRGRREGASGQGWRRNEYRATLPKVLTQGKHVAEEGDEPDDIKVGNEVQHVTPEGGERGSARPAEGGEPDDIKVGNEVPTNQSVNQRTTNTSKCSKDVFAVFDYWQARRSEIPNTKKAKPTDKRLSKVRARLDDDYTVEELKQAIDGCLSSRKNVEGRYIDLELICRDDQHVTQYRAWNRKGQSTGNGPGRLARV